jgi:hypothetical protein
VRDGYGEALCRLTEAELALAALIEGDAGAAARVAARLAAARPVFVRLGAVPEAVDTILCEAEVAGRAGAGEAAARRVVQQVLPMLQQAGLGGSELYRRAVDAAERLAPAVARERVVTQAAMLRSLAAVVVETEPQPATVVAVDAGDEACAMAFARAAIDRGAVVVWPTSRVGAAILLGADHAARAASLAGALDGVPLAAVAGEIDLEHMWPAGVRARGAALDRAVAAVAPAGARGGA